MMKKRLIGFVLALVLALSLIPTTALAVATTDSGTFGHGMEWVLDDQGTLTISGTGSTDVTYMPWAEMRDSIKSVVICDGVTDIGSGAFKYCKNLTTVTIPDSVQLIGNEAFFDCPALKDVTIPSGVTRLNDSVFGLCKSLTSVTIPDTVKTIGDQAFAHCTSLASITIPASVTGVEAYAFCGCNALTDITIPDSVQFVRTGAFSDCTGLKSAVLSKNVTYIAEELFYGCTSLAAFTVPSSVTSIEDSAFENCQSLKTFAIPSSVTYIDKNAFDDCSNLQSFTASTANTAYSSNGGVLYNKNKTEIALFPKGYSGSYTIPGTVSTIGDYTFDSCKKLTSVESSVGLKRIGTGAFVNCKALKTLKFDRGLAAVGNMAFAMCDSLSSVTFLGNAPTFTGTPFLRDTATVYYPAGDNTWTTSVRQNYGGTLKWTCSGSATTLSLSISCSASSGKPALRWNAVSGAAKYEVYRATSSGGTYSKMYTTANTSYTNTSATVGSTYYYKVRAIGSDGKPGNFSAVKSITCDCAQPVVTAACNATSGKPKLTWKAVDGADKYEVYRATSSGGTYSKMYTTTSTSYTNTSAVAGNTYYYKVRAVSNKSSYATSAYSAVKCIVCDCPQPVVRITTSSGKPKISWNAVDGATKYYIYRSTDGGNTYKYYDSTTKTSYTNLATQAGNTYYYKVKAISSRSTYADSALSSGKGIKATK